MKDCVVDRVHEGAVRDVQDLVTGSVVHCDAYACSERHDWKNTIDRFQNRDDSNTCRIPVQLEIVGCIDQNDDVQSAIAT